MDGRDSGASDMTCYLCKDNKTTSRELRKTQIIIAKKKICESNSDYRIKKTERTAAHIAFFSLKSLNKQTKILGFIWSGE